MVYVHIWNFLVILFYANFIHLVDHVQPHIYDASVTSKLAFGHQDFTWDVKMAFKRQCSAQIEFSAIICSIHLKIVSILKKTVTSWLQLLTLQYLSA